MGLDVSSSGALAKSLDACVVSLHSAITRQSGSGPLLLMCTAGALQDPKEPEFNTLVRIMATRCMLSAEYFCSGSVSKESYGHYGLASPIYTHFTVRFPRRLTSAIANTQEMLTDKTICSPPSDDMPMS